ncbi:hypothetical protein [Lyngbya aestuarii]|uniref:hypothetical protein n=1 Tax=Lyngbya aestuarii TaxID=118322 RepID=UPI00403DE7B1
MTMGIRSISQRLQAIKLINQGDVHLDNSAIQEQVDCIDQILTQHLRLLQESLQTLEEIRDKEVAAPKLQDNQINHPINKLRQIIYGNQDAQ